MRVAQVNADESPAVDRRVHFGAIPHGGNSGPSAELGDQEGAGAVRFPPSIKPALLLDRPPSVPTIVAEHQDVRTRQTATVRAAWKLTDAAERGWVDLHVEAIGGEN